MPLGSMVLTVPEGCALPRGDCPFNVFWGLGLTGKGQEWSNQGIRDWNLRAIRPANPKGEGLSAGIRHSLDSIIIRRQQLSTCLIWAFAIADD